MKLPAKSFVGAFAIGLCGCLTAAMATASAAPDTPPPAPVAGTTRSADFSDQQIIEAWGWVIAHEQKVDGIEISEAELSEFLKGVAAGFNSQPSPHDLRKIYPDVEKLAKVRREKLMLTIQQKNVAAAEALVAGLKKSPKVIELPNGVWYEIIVPGDGPYPKPEQTVNVHYIGRLIDGTEFVQLGPIDLVLVPNRSVCRGWIEGLQKVKKGGKIKLYVPPPLPEGDDVRWGIPPGSTMVFEIELLDLKDTTPGDLADSLTPAAPEPAGPPPSGFTELQIIETWGWITALQTHTAKLGLTEPELSLLTKGLVAGIKGQPAPHDPVKIYPEVGKFVNDRQEKARVAFKQQQLAGTEALFAKLKQTPNVIELPSGLFYEIIKPGSGPFPKPGQRVNVNYTGRLINGTVFDSTDPTLGPLDIDLDKVVPGWTEGVQKINSGGKIKLYIPPSLAYGDDGNARIPPNSTLIFDIELLDIKDIPKDDAAPAATEKK